MKTLNLVKHLRDKSVKYVHSKQLFLKYLLRNNVRNDHIFQRIEYTDVLVVYGECNKNSRLSITTYHERHPDIVTSSSIRFWIEQTQKVFSTKKESKPPAKSVTATINILVGIEVNTHFSTRRLHPESGFQKTNLWRIFGKHPT